jgi:hypothetical protein
VTLANSHENEVPFETVGRGRKEVVAASIRLFFIPFLRALTIIRNDPTPTAYYTAGVAKQAIGDRIEMSCVGREFPACSLLSINCACKVNRQISIGYPHVTSLRLSQ